jgi:hypothetical protein
VLGKTFSRPGLAALSGLAEEELEPHLQSLLRKEILVIQVDPLSPERNQLSFVQDLLRRVSYETLSVRERKARHLAAAALLEQSDEEMAAVVAAHYLDAYRASTGDPDASDLRVQARAALTRAAERASSLASAGEAAHYFAQAAELMDDPLEQADLLELAGRAAAQDADLERAHALLQRASELLHSHGLELAAARVDARRADVFRIADRVDEALALVQAAYDALPRDEPDADVALVAAQLARLAFFSLEHERAYAAVEVALDMAEALDLPEVLAEALTTKSLLSWSRPHEGLALVREAASVAAAAGLTSTMLRAQFNLSGLLLEHDRLAEALEVIREGLAVARARGDRSWLGAFVGQLRDVLTVQGMWDEADAALRQDPVTRGRSLAASIGFSVSIRLDLERGDVESAQALLAEHAAMRESADLQARASFLLALALVRRSEERPAEALAAAEESLALWREMGQNHYATEAFSEAVEAALDLGDLERAAALLANARALPLIERRKYLAAHESRLLAKLAARRGEPATEHSERAAALFEALGMSFWHAVTLLEDAEHRRTEGDTEAADALLAEARTTFERLGAEPWLRRADAVALVS